MVTIYSNEISSKSALAASQQIKSDVYENCLSFENFKKEMKKSIESDLRCVKKISW